jgi:DNA-binding MarR family transcriptional regulator
MNSKDIIRGWQAHAAAKFCFASFAGRRIKLGLSEVAALELLQIHGELSPGELGSYLSMPSGSVTALIDRLEHKKFIDRRKNPSDRRSYTVKLSTAAFEQSRKDMLPMINSIDEIGAALPPEGQKAVAEFLNRTSQALMCAVERKKVRKDGKPGF